MKSALSENMFAFGKKTMRDNESLVQIFFEYLVWLPSMEKTYNSETGWTLFKDFKGIEDERIKQIPTYYTDASDNTVLYSGLNSFNEPGFNYDNANIKRVFFLKILLQNINIQTIYSIKKKHMVRNMNSFIFYNVLNNENYKELTGTFISVEETVETGVLSIDNWESTIYVPPDVILKREINNAGVYGFSKNGFDNSFFMGIRGTGYDNVVDGKDNYVFIDVSGGVHKIKFQDFGIQMDGDNFLGGFTIKYKIRKNENNLYDVYIFVNNFFAKKIVNKGIPLQDIKYVGIPKDYTSEKLPGVSFIYESIKTGYIQDIFHKDNNIVKWKTRVNLIQ